MIQAHAALRSFHSLCWCSGYTYLKRAGPKCPCPFSYLELSVRAECESIINTL